MKQRLMKFKIIFKKYKLAFCIGFIWTFVMSMFIGLNLYYVDLIIYEVGLGQARAAFRKDLSYRLWAAGQGGVYVPIEKTKPNPYLSHLPNRDITLSSGQQLTLVNPAYMTRLVQELSYEMYGSKGHLTSLNPLRPENAADKWETKALHRFENGDKEVIEVIETDFFPVLRYMGPLITQEGCLKCHEGQGYRVGDVRGGLSILIPLDSPEMKSIRLQGFYITIGLTFIWIIGCIGIFFESRLSQRRSIEKDHTDKLIKVSLLEKEALLRELYHRTKNNMQVISAYLQLQALHVDNDKLNNMVKDVVSRIQSMSLVHQKLYKSKNLSRINIREYIEELVSLIMSFYNVSTNKITSEFALEDVEMMIDTAIPLGLVISELISNSFKHAFPANYYGIIKIKLYHDIEKVVILELSDNGIGLPENFDVKSLKSIGLSTTISIVEQQLMGSIHYENNNGLKFTIKFKDDLYKERV